MGGLFGGGPKMPAPAPPPPAPTRDDPAVSAAEEERKRQLAAARGRASTIVTGGEGDTSEPTLAKQTLLGS